VIESLKLDKISSSGYSFQIEIKFCLEKGLPYREIPIVFYDRKTRGIQKEHQDSKRSLICSGNTLVSFFKKIADASK
jgi:hypothetical protein